MATQDTFYELAQLNAVKQSKMIDDVTNEAPILKMMPMEPTSDGLKNVYEKLVSVDAAEAVDFDEALVEINADDKLEEVSLSKFGGKMTIGEDKAIQMGGVGTYFSRKLPAILRRTGEKIEKSIIYNNLRASAILNSNAVSAGGSGSVNFSILAVKWVPGETMGLYDEAGLGRGEVFDIMPLNNGSLHDIGNGVYGYGQRLATYFGIQLGNDRNVGAIVNIDPAEALDVSMVTEEQIDDLLLSVRANPANTFLYMHPALKNKLNRYKSSKLQLGVMDNNMKRTFDQWDGVNIITSYNFSNATEATVSL